jgi:hypothetical protein
MTPIKMLMTCHCHPLFRIQKPLFTKHITEVKRLYNIERVEKESKKLEGKFLVRKTIKIKTKT